MIIRVVVTANATVSTYSTLPWPNRSASRPCGMAKTALPTMYAADTCPASP